MKIFTRLFFILILQLCLYQPHAFALTKVDKDGAYSATALAATGDNIAMGHFDGKVRIYDPSSSKLIKTLEGHSKPVACLGSDILGRYILSAAGDGKVILWDGKKGERINGSFNPGASFSSCAVDPGGKYSLAGYGSTVYLWNNGTWENEGIWEGIKDGVYSIAVHYGGKLAAVGGKNGKIGIYSIPSGKLIKTLQAGTDVVASLAFAPKSDILISGGYDKTARIWDISTGELKKELSRHSDTVKSVGISSEAKYAVTGGDDGNVFLWDLESGNAENYLKGEPSVQAVAIDPAARFIAAGVGAPFQEDKYVKILYPQNRKQSRDVYTFQDAQVTLSPLGYVDGAGNFGGYVLIYVGGKLIPYSEAASTYNKPERLKIQLGKGFTP